MLIRPRKVLVVAPHTDDGELGAGGFISKLVRGGSEVHYVAFSSASKSLADHWPKDTLVKEVSAATTKLGVSPDNLYIYDYEVRELNFRRQAILDDLIELRKNNYDLVLCPTLSDFHQDHQTVAEECVRAFKNCVLLGYELIWNNLSFNGQFFVCLEKSDIEKKVESLSEYKSQGERVYMSSDFIHSLALTRGVQAGTGFAECYEVIRWVS